MSLVAAKLQHYWTVFYSSPETWMHVTQMHRCQSPPRFAYTWYIVDAVRVHGKYSYDFKNHLYSVDW